MSEQLRDSLVIHETRFEEFAMRIMENLLDTGVIRLMPTIIGDNIWSEDQALVDHVVDVIKRFLQFQKHTHDNWVFDQDETHRRCRMDLEAGGAK